MILRNSIPLLQNKFPLKYNKLYYLLQIFLIDNFMTVHKFQPPTIQYPTHENLRFVQKGWINFVKFLDFAVIIAVKLPEIAKKYYKNVQQ